MSNYCSTRFSCGEDLDEALSAALCACDDADRAEAAANKLEGFFEGGIISRKALPDGYPYSDIVSEVIKPPVDIKFTAKFCFFSGVGTNNIVVGEKYLVTWGGAKYVRTAFTLGNSPALGNAKYGNGEDTGEPFLFWDMGATSCVLSKATSNHEIISVSVEKVTEEIVYPMDSKYVTPGDSAYDIAVKNGFEGSEEEWLESLKGENASSWGDVSNKPFGIDGVISRKALPGGYPYLEREIKNIFPQTTKELVGGYIVHSFDGFKQDDFEVGKTYIVSWGNEIFECVCFVHNELNKKMFGNASLHSWGGEDTGEPFLLVENQASYSSLWKTDYSALTIDIRIDKVVSETAFPIDKKYLPEQETTVSLTELEIGDGFISCSYNTPWGEIATAINNKNHIFAEFLSDGLIYRMPFVVAEYADGMLSEARFAMSFPVDSMIAVAECAITNSGATFTLMCR